MSSHTTTYIFCDCLGFTDSARFSRAVTYLATQSATGKVSILGHSQGAGIDPQWALSRFIRYFSEMFC